MDEDKKRIVMIISAVALVGIATGIILKTRSGGSAKISSDETRVLKCMNKKCGHTEDITVKKLMKLSEDESASRSNAMGTERYLCPQCNKMSMAIAQKCPKCNTAFFAQPFNPKDYSDRCPNCKYSAAEERAKQQQQ